FLLLTLLGFWVVVNVLGALAALASTLFPIESLRQGLELDLQGEHFSLRLRAFHPLFACLFAAWALRALQRLRSLPAPENSRKWMRRAQVMILLNVLWGFLTLGLLSPTLLKISHLL